MAVKLPTASAPLKATLTPPASKSITHRALLLAALCQGQTRLKNPLEADDTRLTRQALRALGVIIEGDGDSWLVAGRGSVQPKGPGVVRLQLGNSGSSLRFLLPLAALGDGPVLLDGVPRLRQRPVGPLASALNRLGVQVEFQGLPGCPPLVVRGPLQPGRVRLEAAHSSQYLSGLLLAAAGLGRGDRLEIEAVHLVSRSYVDLTRAVLESFGVRVTLSRGDLYQVEGGALCSPGTYEVEADASAAAFLLAAGAVTGGEVKVHGVGVDSIQGDRLFLKLLGRMGCIVSSGDGWMLASGRPCRGVRVNLNGTPDLVPPLFAVALLAPGPSRLSGISHLRLKESDRLAALAGEAGKLGGRVQVGEDFLAIQPAPLAGTRVEAHGDHRIAMALAVVGLVIPGMELDDPACVSKSYPGFFTDLLELLNGRA